MHGARRARTKYIPGSRTAIAELPYYAVVISEHQRSDVIKETIVFDTLKKFMRFTGCIIVAALVGTAPAVAAEAKIDTDKIEKITGMKGTYSQEENVFKVTVPRTDVQVQVDGWTLPPFMGLGPWAAFTPHGSHMMVMGDIVLFQDEVNPVMSAALDAGLGVTALHNHFFYDEPKVYFMHIGGEGDVDAMATGVRKVFDKIKEIRAANAQPSASFAGPKMPAQSSITAQPLEDILGSKGQSSNGMLKVVVGKTIKMHGASVGKEMGVNTWAAFAGSDDNAVVDGDFAMAENELQAVLKAMRKAGINIVAIHHHMSEEQPRILFLHYWGRGKAPDLARAIKTTLDAQATVR